MYWTTLSVAKNVVKFDAKETSISGAKSVVKVTQRTSTKSTFKGRQSRQKDDHCVDLKNEKGQPIAALFNCVFLDTKKRSGSLFICIHYCDNLF